MAVKLCGKHVYFIIVLFVLVFVFIEMKYLTKTKWLKGFTKNCSCQQLHPVMAGKDIKSLCSTRATERGFGQKIIAVSVFGPVENLMFSMDTSLKLLHQLLNEIRQVYADNWILRVYHDGKIFDSATVCQFESQYSFIDFCNTTNIGLDFIPPKIWRFLPAGDETVSVMASRDLDSPLTTRERAAIDEWLSSDLSFHSMRDHPSHGLPLLGGMWAFRSENDRTFSRFIRLKMFNRSLITTYSLTKDQAFLSEHLWPYAQNRTMAHDSYFCKRTEWNAHHRPFPTRRPTLDVTSYCFLGCSRPCCDKWFFDREPCPTECRPKEHQDWTAC